MRQKRIHMSPDCVGHFVNVASNCHFDIDICNEKTIHNLIDGKSYLGILTLDFKGGLIVTYYGEDSAFEELLGELAA